MPVPIWITPPNLGSYSQDYSFDLNPLLITFSADVGSQLTLLNGSLPPGLIWTTDVSANSLVIVGVAVPSTSVIVSRFTFRIRQSNGLVTDRTFHLILDPIPQAPTWETQPSFLGYQGNTIPESYQLNAIPPPRQYVTYELLTSPTGMSINQNTGLLTYNASVIGTNTSILFNVRAQSNSVSSDKDLSIEVVVNPLAPRWTTSPGIIGTFYGTDFVEFNFLATDVTGADVSYTLLSPPVGFPLELSSTGILYGRLEDPLSETNWTFTVRASSINGVSDRVFLIRIIPFSLGGLLVWKTEADLGKIDEGQCIELQLRATTERNAPIVYNVIGGMLPPHLMLNSTEGTLVGYVDYQAISKDYMFDVSATDGYQTIVRQFQITISKKYTNQFFGTYIPITGDMRDRWAADVSNVRAREPGTTIVNTIGNLVDPPFLNIVNGVVTGYQTPDQLFNRAKPWLHTLGLNFGFAANTSVIEQRLSTNSSNTSIIYREVMDQQAGANLSVYSSAVFNTNVQTNGMVYPISIENLRTSLVGDDGYVSGGGGSNLQLQPFLDWNNGSISKVLVINAGLGFLSPPQLKITGSGTDAAISAILGLVEIQVIDGGQGWSIGDLIEIPGDYNTAAVIRITATNINGSISSISIVERGNYRQVYAVDTLPIYRNQVLSCILKPSWGVVDVSIDDPGRGYECEIGISTKGSEILPSWQERYFPAIEIGDIPIITANHSVEILNFEDESLLGTKWEPSYIVFKWEGLRWIGTSSFDAGETTFDGGTTRFEETEDARQTIFDDRLTRFDNGLLTFDYKDPLWYDLWQVWGSTMFDEGTTVFDLYSTIFDALRPRKYSNTLVQKWISMTNQIYSSNNAVW